MISNKHKYIFVHIPKCGGTSIEKILLDNENVECNWDCRLPLNSLSRENKHKYKLGHRSWQHQISIFPEKTQQTFFSFTFVRNPWDRIVSSWRYHKQVLKREYDLKTFARLPRDNKQVGLYHLDTQVSFININTNFIGRFENLQHDFNIVCDKIGISRKVLPHKNKSKHKHYTEYYDDETREIVAERYAQDIEQFGYKFGE